MQRIAIRTLPDGSIRKVYPYHVCIKGLEQAILCREAEDYDAMVKVICLSARRKNVIVIIYAVISNHCHVAILAASQKDADAFAYDLKKVYSMWFSRKYQERNVLHRITVRALYLDTDWYVRNALAYIPRNALDNGCNIHEYPWSGYRAMFSRELPKGLIPVSSLSRRECRAFLHTGDKLDQVPWLINSDGQLEPRSFCDCLYLEQAFNNDQAFFLKTIGGQDTAQMKYDLEEKPYKMVSDSEMQKVADEVCLRWFQAKPAEISTERKTRVLSYLYHSRKTTVVQLSRVLQLPREQVAHLLGIT